MSRFNSVGSVVKEVDRLFEEQRLHVVGGVSHYDTGGLTLALATKYDDKKAGEAFCALPGGGWERIDYFPTLTEEGVNDRRHNLALSKVAGCGKILFPEVRRVDLSDLGIAETEPRREVKRSYIVNDSGDDELFVVHGIVENHPEIQIGEVDLYSYNLHGHNPVMSNPLSPTGRIRIPIDLEPINYSITVNL